MCIRKFVVLSLGQHCRDAAASRGLDQGQTLLVPVCLLPCCGHLADNVIAACRAEGIKALVYTSSMSVVNSSCGLAVRGEVVCVLGCGYTRSPGRELLFWLLITVAASLPPPQAAHLYMRGMSNLLAVCTSSSHIHAHGCVHRVI